MQLRPKSKFLLAAALGLALTAAAQAQLLVNVTERATISNFVGGTNNNVTGNGSTNLDIVVSTGTSASGDQFSITYDPQTGPSSVDLGTGTLTTTTLLFDSTISPVNYFSTVSLAIDTDFDSDGVFDLTQNYMINLSSFTSPNGFTGISYEVVPVDFFGTVVIDGVSYSYASAVSNNTGVLLDGSNTTAAIQFQFIATPVPEPSTYALAGLLALGGIVACRRRRTVSSQLAPLAQAGMA